MNAYPKYKDSGIDWLGKIPEHWSKIATKRLFEIYSGATPQSDNEKFWDGDIIWVTPADYNTSDHYISSSKRTISKDGYNSCSTVLAPKGCIVFSKRAPIGKVAIADVELCTNQGCLCCVPHEGANSNYYYYLMSILNHFYNQLGSGSTFLEISAQSFADFSLILPSHAEQEAIAQYLDIKTAKINKLMAEKANQVENLRSYRTSVITEAVTHGLNPDAPLRQSGIDWIGEIPEHWIVTKLGRVLDGIQDGTHGSYNRVDVGHPLLSAKNVTEDGIIISDNESLINETDYNNIIANGYPRKGDIAMCCVATIGRGCIYQLDEPQAFQRSVTFLRINKNHSNTYILFFLRSVYGQAQFSTFAKTSAQGGVYMGDLKQFCVILPPLSEQQEIAAYLDAKTAKIDRLIDELNAQITELADYKQAVISEAVTGKVDVRNYRI